MDTATPDRAQPPNELASFDAWAAREWNEGLQIDTVPDFERLVVRTRHTVYEIIVLCGETGDVLIRGGAFFPEFRRARLTGATGRGSALKLLGIYVGFHMELQLDRQRIVTSRVESIVRQGPADVETAAVA
jgi:hypothetical protein